MRYGYPLSPDEETRYYQGGQKLQNYFEKIKNELERRQLPSGDQPQIIGDLEFDDLWE